MERDKEGEKKVRGGKGKGVRRVLEAGGGLVFVTTVVEICCHFIMEITIRTPKKGRGCKC